MCRLKTIINACFLVSLLLITACRLTKRERIELFNQQQLSTINELVKPLVETDSVRVFDEITVNRRNEKLGEILYIRLYGSKKLPADNNQAEALARKACNLIIPKLTSPEKYILWKVQFASKNAEEETFLQKIFNFVPSEIINP